MSVRFPCLECLALTGDDVSFSSHKDRDLVICQLETVEHFIETHRSLLHVGIVLLERVIETKCDHRKPRVVSCSMVDLRIRRFAFHIFVVPILAVDITDLCPISWVASLMSLHLRIGTSPSFLELDSGAVHSPSCSP